MTKRYIPKPRFLLSKNVNWKRDLEKLRAANETGYAFSIINNCMSSLGRALILLFINTATSIYILMNSETGNFEVFGFELSRFIAGGVVAILSIVFLGQVTHILSSIKHVLLEKVEPHQMKDAVLLIRTHTSFLNPYSISAIPIIGFGFVMAASYVAPIAAFSLPSVCSLNKVGLMYIVVWVFFTPILIWPLKRVYEVGTILRWEQVFKTVKWLFFSPFTITIVTGLVLVIGRCI